MKATMRIVAFDVIPAQAGIHVCEGIRCDYKRLQSRVIPSGVEGRRYNSHGTVIASERRERGDLL
jgi:hypothetical protein